MNHLIQCVFITIASMFVLASCKDNPNQQTAHEPTATEDSIVVVNNEDEDTVAKTVNINTSPEKESNPSNNKTIPPAPEKVKLSSTWLTAAKPKLERWAGYHAQAIPNFDLEYFVVVDTFYGMDFPELPHTPTDAAFEAYRIPSPNGKLQLDIYSYERKLKKGKNGKITLTGASPDSEVSLHGLKAGTKTRLLFCGTPCHFEDAAWLDNNTVVIAGYTNEINQKYHPMLWRIDLKKKSVWQYLYPEPLRENNKNYLTSIVFAQ